MIGNNHAVTDVITCVEKPVFPDNIWCARVGWDASSPSSGGNAENAKFFDVSAAKAGYRLREAIACLFVNSGSVTGNFDTVP